MSGRILVVDDDRSIRESLELYLEEEGFAVAMASCRDEALRAQREFDPQIVVLDIRLGAESGLDLLTELRSREPAPTVIMVTAFSDMDTTVHAMKWGAADYIHKPIDIDELRRAIDKALQALQSSARADSVRMESDSLVERGLVGTSRAMREIYKTIGLAAQSRATVLILGESGTGKELIARAIHEHSTPDEPFIAVNCSALVGTLLESELFGHVRGAFTGAHVATEGKFIAAGKGTIFLDEIGELSAPLQAKLLRVLQEREVVPVGATQARPVEARIIAATNKDLDRAVESGEMREDLYYRLNVVTIPVPPLRDRGEDIPLLVEHLLHRINQQIGRRVTIVPRRVMERLQELPWKGNVRQLENLLTSAVALSSGEVLDEALIPLPSGVQTMEFEASSPVLSLREVERRAIAHAIRCLGTNKGRLCEVLGISRPTLDRKLKAYDLTGAFGSSMEPPAGADSS
jgi:two-component system response regulator AtoC